MQPVTKAEYIQKKVDSTRYYNEPVAEWLNIFPSMMSVRSGAGRLKYYLEWLNKTDIELIQEYKNAQNKHDWNKVTSLV